MISGKEVCYIVTTRHAIQFLEVTLLVPNFIFWCQRSCTSTRSFQGIPKLKHEVRAISLRSIIIAHVYT